MNQMAAHSVVQPFYNDHTAYGMALGMLVPVLIGLYVNYWSKMNLKQHIGFILLILLFITATLFSYTRATWVSLAGVAGIWVLVLLKIKWQYVLAMGIILFSLFFTFQTEIKLKLEGNKQTSSGKVTEHIQSISNVKTDASNLESIKEN